jgi:hypothetical protein
LGVRHQINVPDAKVRVHAVPPVVDGAPLASAGAAASVGHRRAGDFDNLGHRDFGQGEDRLTLGPSDVIIDHVAGTEHDGHAEVAQGVECPIHAGNDGVDAHGGGLAPMEIPDIDHHDTDAFGIEGFDLRSDLSGGWIAGPEGPRDRFGGTSDGDQGGADQEEKGRGASRLPKYRSPWQDKREIIG